MYNISCLRYIVVSICDICNMQCITCPHSIKEWRDSHTDVMTKDTAMILNMRLLEIMYRGIVSISGMGEPLMNKDTRDIISLLSRNRIYQLQIITNGYCLLGKDNDLIDFLLDHCDKIYISIHDMNKEYGLFKKYEKMSKKIELRNHDISRLNSTLLATNRGGTMCKNIERKERCYYPYYEIAIDCLGNYLWCAHDFEKKSIRNNCNIYEMSIEDYFINATKDKKMKMYTMDGQLDEPCKYCDCLGFLDGRNEYDEFVKHFCKKEGSSWLNLLWKYLKI